LRDLTIRTKNDRSASYIIEIKASAETNPIPAGAGIDQAEKKRYIANFEEEGFAKNKINLIEIIIESVKVKHIATETAK
jgi:hypothetical protein